MTDTERTSEDMVVEDHRHDPHGPGLLAELRTGAWLDGQRIPPLTFVIPGVIPEGLTLLVGAPKIGKSWLALSVALAVATGGRALGELPVTARPVLLLALEDGDRRLQERCRVLLSDEPIPAALEYLTHVRDGRVPDTVAAWLDRHPGTEPLIIVDTLGRVMPSARPGESAYQRDYRVGAALKTLVDDRPGSGLVILHHDRKAAADDFVDSVSGTHGLAGAADTIAVLTRPRHQGSGLLAVTGRDVEEAEYALTATGGRWALDGAGLAAARAAAQNVRASAGVGDRSAEILAYVVQHPGPVRAVDVETALSMPDARRYLTRLAAAGRVMRVDRGLYDVVPNP